MIRPVASELARLLRADVPPLEDEQFVLTLAEAARNSPTPPLQHRVPLAIKVGAIAASVAVTMFGAAYASDILAPDPPTNSNPTSPGTDEPTEPKREIRGPRKSDGPVHNNPSPVTGTESPQPDGVPTDVDEEPIQEAGTPHATAPAGPEEDHSPEGPATEQPPTQSDPGPEDDDSEGDPDSDEPDDDSETDGDGSEDDNEPDDSDPDPEDDSQSDDDSGAESHDEPDDNSDDD